MPLQEQPIANRARSRGELPIPADSDKTKEPTRHRVFPLLTAFSYDLSASASRRLWEAVSLYDCTISCHGRVLMHLCRVVNLSVHPARLLEATAGECDEPGYNMAYW